MPLRQPYPSELRRLFTDASHDLRTPLAGLRAELEEARLHPEQTGLAELVERALCNVDRLQAVLSDLLLQTRPVEGSAGRELVNLADLVRVELFRRTGRWPVHAWLPRGIFVNAVPCRLSLAIGCLLDNAQRHAASGVLIEIVRDGADAELSIAHDGPGGAEAGRGRVLAPFTHPDPGHDHVLGLAVIREIAHAHEGTLRTEDFAAGGVRFVLRLPLAVRT
ncbi:HAMP domain-containing sensor histidine kinase [Streptosporangium sp. NPDC048047]|uniref:sensor histidine kinase n=1 Tax=Streptosporangium sp. NPDC048047 TaxID=3155748 RepID=UPI003445C76E